MIGATRICATIPTRTILIFETDELAFMVRAGIQAGGGERHHGNEGVGRGAVSGRMRGEQHGEADRLVAEIRADDGVAAGGLVAFVEEESASRRCP